MSQPRVLDSDPIGVICIYKLELSCGHSITYETRSNRIPATAACYKCQIKKEKGRSTFEKTRNYLKRLTANKKKL